MCDGWKPWALKLKPANKPKPLWGNHNNIRKQVDAQLGEILSGTFFVFMQWDFLKVRQSRYDFFQADDSSKKQTKEFDFTMYYDTSGRL